MATIRIRRNTAAGAASSNPVLAAGEPGFETDTGVFKIGDGSTAWNDLDPITGGGSSNFLGLYTSLVNLEAAHATATSGNWAIVDPGSGTDAVKYLWDEDEGWVSGGSGAGVLGITGDGVDNTDPANPVISYPTPGDISAANAVHTHAISDVTNLQTNLDAKAAHTNSATALTDGAAITLTATKHTLTSTQSAITFTVTYAGDDIVIVLTLNAASATWTFPAGSLCVSEGVASGDNTLGLSGVSGDKYIITTKKVGSVYYVVAKNFGQ